MGNPLGDDFNHYTRDIRALEDLSDFQEIRVWDAVFSTEIMEADIVLSFNIINKETLDGEYGYTRLFVLHDKNNDGQPEYTEVEDGDNYTFFHSNINDSLKIIVGAPGIVSNSRVTVVSPNGSEIRSIEENLVVELEYELLEFIHNLKLDLQILECSDAAYTTKDTCELAGEEWSAVNSFNVFDGSPEYEFSIPSLIIENFYNTNSNGVWEDANCVDHPEIENEEDCEAHSYDYLSRFFIQILMIH